MKSLQLLVILMATRSSVEEILRLECQTHADFSISLQGLADVGSILTTHAVTGLRECVLHCISLPNCKAVNYKKDGGNCELVGRQLTKFLVSKTGWTFVTTDHKEIRVGSVCKKLSPCENGARCVDMCTQPRYKCLCDSKHSGTRCEDVREFTSCLDAYNSGFTTSGIYKLTGMGYHYCVMKSLGECSGTGWTLVMKTKGTKNTFIYSSSYWTASNTYNHVYGLKEGLSGEEAKFDAFNKMPFTKLCLVFEASGKKTYLKITKTASSLLNVMNSGYQSTSFGRSKWLGLISGSRLQSYCNREGFNALGVLRIGILANNEANCITPDTVLGVGSMKFCSQSTYSGNHGCFLPHSYNKHNIPADVRILIQ